MSALIAVPLGDGRWLALTSEALREAVAAAQNLGLGPVAGPVSGTGIEPLLNSEDMAKLLGIHSTTVEGMARTGAIPSIRIGKALRFEPSAVKAALRGSST
jgi:excisionase family DNA binding protein